MTKKVVIIGVIILLTLLIGCETKEAEETVKIDNPFIGGTQGIEVTFENLRADVRDQTQDPFDIILKIENKGETDIPKEYLQARISGINPAEFGKSPLDLIKNAEDAAIGQKKSPEGEIIPNPPSFIEFLGLNYQQKITGTQITFPLKADICYNYITKGIGKLCIREDILNPEQDGICEVTGDKTVYSSSAPIQIANLKESARSQNKIGFTFEILNAGDGNVYKQKTSCTKAKRQNENKLFLRVKTNLQGLKCVGLNAVGSDLSEGEITLYANSRVVSCTQETPINDFEQVIQISAEYDYEISKTSQIIVKSAGVA